MAADFTGQGAPPPHRHSTTALGQFLTIVPQNDRQMTELRQCSTQSTVHVDLPGRVVDVLVTAEHMADRHVPVVHHDREVVGGHTIGTLDDQVVNLGVADADRPFDQVVPVHHAIDRVGKADDGLDAFRNGRQHLARCGAPSAVVQALFTTRFLRGFHGFQVFGRAVAAVCGASGQHLVDHGLVAIETLHLVDRAFVVAQTQPVHRVQDLVHRVLGGAGHIGVFNAQHELAAVVTGIGP